MAVRALGLAVVSLIACAAVPQQPSTPFVGNAETLLGQLIAHGGLALSMEAKLQSDSAWSSGFAVRREPAMCIPRGAYAYGVALNGQPFVLVLGFGPANIKGADSVNVFWDGSICGDSIPSYHGHFVENGMRWKPSPCDMHQSALRANVPFHLMASDTGKVTAYMPDQDFATRAIPWCGIP